MKKVRRFNGEDGSMVSGLYGDEANERFAKLMNDAKAEEAPAEAEPAPENTRVQPDFDRFSGPAAKPQNFKSAFADARSAGSKTFEFGGKKYTTELAKPSAPSTPSAPSAPSAPAAAPKADTPKAEDKKADTPVERELSPMSAKERAAAIAQIPTGGNGAGPTPSAGNSASGSELGRNISNTLSALPISRGIQVVQSGAKLAGRKAVEEFVKKDPNWRNKELEILKDIPKLLGGPKKQVALPAPPKQLALPAPPKRLPYDRPAASAAESTKAKLAGELRRGAQPTKFTSPSKSAASKKTRKFNEDEGGVEFRRGGSVSSASKRADGCAIRGKTRA